MDGSEDGPSRTSEAFFLANRASRGLRVRSAPFVYWTDTSSPLAQTKSLTLQAAGMLTFGATALVAFYVDPDSGGHLVAFAFIGHAAWDAVHYVQNRVVARLYAEFCAVLDPLVGAAILLLA